MNRFAALLDTYCRRGRTPAAPSSDELDEFFRSARDVVDAGRTDGAGAGPVAECPECGRDVPVTVPLFGDELRDALVQLLAPSYGQDGAVLDTDVRRWIAGHAAEFAAAMDQLGFHLVRRDS